MPVPGSGGATHNGPGKRPRSLISQLWLGLFGKEETVADGSTVTMDEAYLGESIVDPNAKIVRDHMARKHGAENVRWLASEGETRGWDTEVRTAERVLRIEVKGTTSRRFHRVEISANEWAAANEHQDTFVLALVARCLSKEPVLTLTADPVGEIAGGAFTVEPSGWWLTR